jgi:hypothetical protein
MNLGHTINNFFCKNIKDFGCAMFCHRNNILLQKFRLVKKWNMEEKVLVIRQANGNGFSEITANNSIFANVNSRVNVWWLEFDNLKFSDAAMKLKCLRI